MARYRRNPDLFGEDLVPLAWMAGGVGLTAYVEDKVVHPVVSGILPVGDPMLGKAVDAAGTAATAWLLGELIKQVDAAVAKLVKRGGLLLAMGKVISIPVPQFSISAKFPELPLWPAAPVPQLPAASNGAIVSSQNSGRLLGVGSMGI